MSSKRRKQMPRSSAYGPSKPVDPRYAPGRAPRGYQQSYQRSYQGGYRRAGIPPFATGMIVVVGLALVVFVVALLLQNSGGSSSANNSNTAAQQGGAGTVSPNWTQTMVAFSTQTAPDILPRVTIQEAKAMYDAGNIKLIDVRLKELYDKGHIKGAVNVPQAEVGNRVKDLPREGNLVLYCDCPHDEESAGTAYTLKTAGYTNMHVLQGPLAYTEWKNVGYPVEP